MSEKSVVVLSDDQISDTVATVIVEACGYVPSPAQTRETFEAALNHGVGLAVLGVSVAGFDGIDAIHAMVNADKIVPLVLLCNGSPDMCEIVTKYAEMKGFEVLGSVSKPLHPDALQHVLTQINDL